MYVCTLYTQGKSSRMYRYECESFPSVRSEDFLEFLDYVSIIEKILFFKDGCVFLGHPDRVSAVKGVNFCFDTNATVCTYVHCILRNSKKNFK